jgi:CheY-like chemotaxis protein
MTKRILIIDDEPDLREIIKLSLEAFTTWKIEMVGSGLEGIQMAMTQAFDAILLDVSMPEMDGIQVFEQLRSQPDTVEIPVLLVTAKARTRDRQQFIKMGVTGVVIKPFNPRLIAKQIADILGWEI